MNRRTTNLAARVTFAGDPVSSVANDQASRQPRDSLPASDRDARGVEFLLEPGEMTLWHNFQMLHALGGLTQGNRVKEQREAIAYTSSSGLRPRACPRAKTRGMPESVLA